MKRTVSFKITHSFQSSLQSHLCSGFRDTHILRNECKNEKETKDEEYVMRTRFSCLFFFFFALKDLSRNSRSTLQNQFHRNRHSTADVPSLRFVKGIESCERVILRLLFRCPYYASSRVVSISFLFVCHHIMESCFSLSLLYLYNLSTRPQSETRHYRENAESESR